MKITTRKVAIVGCGLVGSTTAFSLVTQGVCDEVMLIDINKERAYGEMLDMRDSIEYLNRNVKVKTGTYAACGLPERRQSRDRRDWIRWRCRQKSQNPLLNRL